jgi:hypothetical protein
VREGSLDALLSDQGVVRVRVPGDDLANARTALESIAPVEVAPPSAVRAEASRERWLTVHVPPNRAAEVNRRLAEAAIFASGLESGTELEQLFLELTGGGDSTEGRMQGIATPDAAGPAA